MRRSGRCKSAGQGWEALSAWSHRAPLTAQQDAEKVCQRRSHFAQRLNVPKRTPRLFACCGLVGQPF